mmetsp:Transcript_70597/g.121165  ORF Transcript_70597/g.121165 Transcript_70597/m.121165 type:complete len:238 (-) Transcript_70597:517-1230(-)
MLLPGAPQPTITTSHFAPLPPSSSSSWPPRPRMDLRRIRSSVSATSCPSSDAADWEKEKCATNASVPANIAATNTTPAPRSSMEAKPSRVLAPRLTAAAPTTTPLLTARSPHATARAAAGKSHTRAYKQPMRTATKTETWATNKACAGSVNTPPAPGVPTKALTLTKHAAVTQPKCRERGADTTHGVVPWREVWLASKQAAVDANMTAGSHKSPKHHGRKEVHHRHCATLANTQAGA